MVNVAPFLWFNDNAEEALDFYAGAFANSEIVDVTRMDVPTVTNGASELLSQLLGDPDPLRAGRVQEAMVATSKIECVALQAAYDA